jgi:hypothetical protein
MAFQKGHKINVGKKNHLGFKHSEESKRKIGLKSKGRRVWNNGISWPEEMKKRISQTNHLLSWLLEKFWPVPGWTQEAQSQNKVLASARQDR